MLGWLGRHNRVLFNHAPVGQTGRCRSSATFKSFIRFLFTVNNTVEKSCPSHLIWGKAWQLGYGSWCDRRYFRWCWLQSDGFNLESFNENCSLRFPKQIGVRSCYEQSCELCQLCVLDIPEIPPQTRMLNVDNFEASWRLQITFCKVRCLEAWNLATCLGIFHGYYSTFFFVKLHNLKNLHRDVWRFKDHQGSAVMWLAMLQKINQNMHDLIAENKHGYYYS